MNGVRYKGENQYTKTQRVKQALRKTFANMCVYTD